MKFWLWIVFFFLFFLIILFKEVDLSLLTPQEPYLSPAFIAQGNWVKTGYGWQIWEFKNHKQFRWATQLRAVPSVAVLCQYLCWFCWRKGAIRRCSGALQALSACADLHDPFFLEWSVLKWAAAIRPLCSLPWCLWDTRHVSWFSVLCFSEHLGQKGRLDTGTLEGTGRLQTYATTISLTTKRVILLPF